MERLFSEFWSTSFSHLLKNCITCPGEVLEISFFVKKFHLCKILRSEANFVRIFFKKVILAVEKLHSTYREVHLRGFCWMKEAFFITFEPWVKKIRTFAVEKRQCCQNSIQRIQNYFFEHFHARILFSKIFSDFERNSFGPFRTLYSENCSRIWGTKSLDFSQKNLSRVANLHSTCPQVHLVDLFLEKY